MESSQVRVAVRIRPLTSRETSEGGKVAVDSNAFNRTVSLAKRKFTYDSVFHPTVTQLDLYNNVAPPLLDAFLGGYNATVIAYGQTGSGKTYTMGSESGVGVEKSGNLSDNVGLIPRFTSHLFATLVERREASEKALLQTWEEDTAPKQSVSLIDFQLSASFIEVYGENVYDLLDDSRDPLQIREDSNKAVFVQGLKCVSIANSSEAMNVLNIGTMNRTTASTLMNLTSSRSHACFTINLQQTTRSADGEELVTTSRFTFVDLAGSERMKKTGAEGNRAREGIKINEGLLALGNVINALADEERLAKGGRVHVPYRQSKLTRLLQEALGGNSQTLFLACVSPSDTNASESLSTLIYANRARNIKNAPQRGVDAKAEELRRLRTLTTLLQCELIKHRYSTAEPEVEPCIGFSEPHNIGMVNEDLMHRDDVLAYIHVINEKASQLSGTKTLSSPDQQKESLSTFVVPMNTNGSSPTERNGYDAPDESDEDINPDDDAARLADELLESDQIVKIEGDIEEQEQRLIQLKASFAQYRVVQERYDMLTNEVNRLEAEKQELVEKLEKAQSGEESTSWMKSKLQQVKASLVRARLDVREQQQKCRAAELDAQRCKGLERRIEELKNMKANMIKKQHDDAKRQQDLSKTKAREIQDAKKREHVARKTNTKLMAENQRLKNELDNSRARNNKLSKKLMETESNLKQALSTRRNGKKTSANEESSIARTNSIKHVLDNTVAEKVALTQSRSVYKTKVALRESLFHSMTTEVKVLNELKRDCEEIACEPSIEMQSDIRDREDNVQAILIQMELVEKHIEDIQARFPKINDHAVDDITFREDDPSLKIISKLNWSDLRALLLCYLRSAYAYAVRVSSHKKRHFHLFLIFAHLFGFFTA